MSATAFAANPFSLMMEPEAVLQAVERSSELRSLKLRRIQPLDVMPAHRGAGANAFDTEIDEASFPLWRDLISSSDPDFFPALFS